MTLLLLLALLSLPSQDATPGQVHSFPAAPVETGRTAREATTPDAIIEAYAEFAYEAYSRCEQHAVRLQAALQTLVAEPTAEHLESAREAWLEGRRDYGRTEVLRFYGGPIDNSRDGVETFLNAWPLDEAYIDAVPGASHPGIIGDPQRYPNIDETMLVLLNERGGEKNVSIGWHAIEFLLWGPDTNPNGPGQRSFQDYLPEVTDNAERRGQYLLVCAKLLVRHHRQVREAWDPDRDNYRRRFLKLPTEESLRSILAGMLILSGFEMSGERLAVAYETQEQEEEHSCFSDNTHIDFLANQEGLCSIFSGLAWDQQRVGVVHWAREVAPELTLQVEADIEASLAAIQAMHRPFDQAIQAPEGSEARASVEAALLALERQSESLAALCYELGYEIAMQPGG